MRLAITLAALIAAQPAAACHRFSRWYYPYPQRCSTTHQGEPDKSWFVEIVLPDDPRAEAIEQLKKELAK